MAYKSNVIGLMLGAAAMIMMMIGTFVVTVTDRRMQIENAPRQRSAATRAEIGKATSNSKSPSP